MHKQKEDVQKILKMFALFKLNGAALIKELNSLNVIEPIAEISIDHVIIQWQNIQKSVALQYNIKVEDILSNPNALTACVDELAVTNRGTIVCTGMGMHGDNFGKQLRTIGLENKFVGAFKLPKASRKINSDCTGSVGGNLFHPEYGFVSRCKPNHHLENCALGDVQHCTDVAKYIENGRGGGYGFQKSFVFAICDHSGKKNATVYVVGNNNNIEKSGLNGSAWTTNKSRRR